MAKVNLHFHFSLNLSKPVHQITQILEVFQICVACVCLFAVPSVGGVWHYCEDFFLLNRQMAFRLDSVWIFIDFLRFSLEIILLNLSKNCVEN